MKDRIHRILSVILAITLIMMTFASCTSKTEDEEEIKPPETVEAPEDNADLVNFDDYTLESETEAESESDEGDASESESTTKSTASATTTTRASGSSSPSGSSSGSSSGNRNSSTTQAEESTSSSGITRSDMIKALNNAGYVYDEEQDIYYTPLEPWQKNFGFTGQYDTAAGYLAMEYCTFKCDFTYGGKMWRIQCWKGQYALLSGAEMGVYTKDPDSGFSDDFYGAAGDDELLNMGFTFYKTSSDFNKRKALFTREMEYHWWQTGFKFGYCNPTNCVVEMTIEAKNSKMADGIESGLKAVKDAQGRSNGFVKYGTSTTNPNVYQRTGNTIKFYWITAGYTNYNGTML